MTTENSSRSSATPVRLASVASAVDHAMALDNPHPSDEAKRIAVDLGVHTHWSARTWIWPVDAALRLGLTPQDIYGSMSPRVLWWAVDYAYSQLKRERRDERPGVPGFTA